MRRAIVIGGGLAGISAAWELSRQGWEVELYESRERLGGKAGSELSNSGYLSDHGYHLFPSWYENVRQLMGEAGIDYDQELIPGERFVSRFRGRDEVTGMPEGSKLDRLIAGFVFAWAIGELVVAENESLESESLASFFGSVFSHQYGSAELCRAAVSRHGSLTLKALSNEASNISALTCARMWRRWMSPVWNVAKPSWSALRGSLQKHLIDPLEDALLDQGVTIHKPQKNDEPKPVTDLVFEEHNGKKQVVSMKYGDEERSDLRDYQVILAVPAEKLEGLFSESSPGGTPGWAEEISRTTTGQMSAIDYELDPLVMGTPVDHFGFGDTDLTGFDITRNWLRDELPPTAVRGKAAVRTVLQVIATNSDSKAETDLDSEVKPQVAGVLDRSEMSIEPKKIHLNEDAELYLNTVKNSQNRPDWKTPADNGFEGLFLAGDYCFTSIDVASMEAAVASGRFAAEAAMGRWPRQVEVNPCWVRVVMRLCRWSGLFDFVAWLSRRRSSRMDEKSSPECSES